MTNGEARVSGRRWLLGCAAVVAILGLPIVVLALLWWRQALPWQPPAILERELGVTPHEVDDLRGGGLALLGREDVWIAFRSERELWPGGCEGWTPGPIDEVRASFPREAEAPRESVEGFVRRRENRDEWLIHEPGSGGCWYRSRLR